MGVEVLCHVQVVLVPQSHFFVVGPHVGVGTLPNGYARSSTLPRLQTDSYGPSQGRTILALGHPSVTAEPHQSTRLHSTIRQRPLDNCRIK